MASIVTLTLNPALDVATGTQRVLPTIKIRCASPVVQAGGGGVNVARVAHRLGIDAAAIVLVGGAHGDELMRQLSGEGVFPDPVPIEGETRLSLTVDERSTGEQFRFVLPGPAVSEADAERALARLEAAAADAKVVVMSGSMPPGLGEAIVARAAAAAARADAAFLLDGPADVLTHCRGAALIKPNARELQDLVGRTVATPSDLVEAAEELIGKGLSRAVLVSLGADGALLVDDGGARRFSSPPVVPKSAVGAGDSMVAAIAVALARGEPLADAAAFGVAAGAAAVLTEASELCHADDVEELRPLVQSTFLHRETVPSPS